MYIKMESSREQEWGVYEETLVFLVKGDKGNAMSWGKTPWVLSSSGCCL